MLSVVIPALNASRSLRETLASVEDADEAVVVDGGSTDATAELAASLGARVVQAQRGRGSQLAAGVAAAQGDWLLLLHADTRLATGWQSAIGAHMAGSPGRAGYCRFRLDSDDRQARRLERLVAWRVRVLALPYGDQGLLIHRDLLRQIGGIRPLPLMEDVDLVRRLGRRRLAPLGVAAITSAEKWQRQGWHRRSLRNLLCLMLYFAGVPPRLIARLYA
jgi:rSAM/selenodomain-associated transferase 2